MSTVIGVKVALVVTVTSLRPGSRDGGVIPVLAAGLMTIVAGEVVQLRLTNGMASLWPAVHAAVSLYCCG